MVSVLMLSASAGFAQLVQLPPPSSDDGVLKSSKGANAGVAHWDSPSGLAAYAYASDANLPTPNMGAPDDVLGLHWDSSSPSYISRARSQLAVGGGTVRAIFLGESAGWRDDFGYVYGSLANGGRAYTVFSDISAVGPCSNIGFGDYIDIALEAEEVATFDFWFNAAGGNECFLPFWKRGNTYAGGVYTVFDRSNSDPYLPESALRWSQAPVMASTWIEATRSYMNVPTYLVGVEDWRLDRGSDRDGNDFMFALQFFGRDGTPFSPVPEPSTYGLLGSTALLALGWFRRHRKGADR